MWTVIQANADQVLWIVNRTMRKENAQVVFLIICWFKAIASFLLRNVVSINRMVNVWVAKQDISFLKRHMGYAIQRILLVLAMIKMKIVRVVLRLIICSRENAYFLLLGWTPSVISIKMDFALLVFLDISCGMSGVELLILIVLTSIIRKKYVTRVTLIWLRLGLCAYDPHLSSQVILIIYNSCKYHWISAFSSLKASC